MSSLPHIPERIEIKRGKGVGVEPNHTTERKSGLLEIIHPNFSFFVVMKQVAGLFLSIYVSIEVK
jgi:hypothetical protein